MMSIADSATIHSGHHSLFLCARHWRRDLTNLTKALRNTHMSAIRAALAWCGVKCPRTRAAAINLLSACAVQISADGYTDPATVAAIAADMEFVC